MKEKIISQLKKINIYCIGCVEYTLDDGLLYWRERFFNALLFFMTLIGTIVIIPNILASIQTNNILIAAIDLLFYFICITLFLNKRIRLFTKVAILIIGLYILSIFLLLQLGQFGPGLTWLAACSVVTALLRGLKAAVISIIFNLFIILFIAFLLAYFKSNLPSFEEYNVLTWIAVSMNLILINVITAIPLAILLQTLDKTLLSEKKLKKEQIIYSRKLEVEKQKAQESDQLKSAFLANLSHDIRTPMNAIMGFSEIIHMECEDPKTKKYTNQIFKNSEYLKNLINDIVDISLIESKQVKFNYKNQTLNSTIIELKSMIEILPQLAGRPDLNIYYSINKEILNREIYLDKTHLKQILINLITNSIKYTKKGEIEITIKPDGENMFFSIRDTGIGIPEDQQSKIFKRFLKIERKSEFKIPGIGLGLSICKALTEAMGGKIWFESIEEKGTSFFFTLPIK